MWHYIVKKVNKNGVEELYFDGNRSSFAVRQLYDLVQANHVRKPHTITFWARIGFDLKYWSYAQKWSFAQLIIK